MAAVHNLQPTNISCLTASAWTCCKLMEQQQQQQQLFNNAVLTLPVRRQRKAPDAFE